MSETQPPLSTVRSNSFRSSSIFNSSSNQQLFQTPHDLECPITLTLFQDPVINSLGQVYERSAIQRHLIQAAVNGQPPTDPVSNVVLPSLDLVPVFPMRSRAAEYRESTARKCLQLAAAPECHDPVRYLRRAAELVLSALGASNSSSSAATTATTTPGTGSGCRPSPTQLAAAPVRGNDSSSSSSSSSNSGSRSSKGSLACSLPGMTVDFARYLTAHHGDAYSALVLKYFGNELLRAGCPDAAADVFYRLLLEAEDQVQQTEYLQLCLDCWTSSSVGAAAEAACSAREEGSNASHRMPDLVSDAAGCEQRQQQQEQGRSSAATAAAAAAAAAAASVNPLIINKLADFVQRQQSLSPRAIIHMLQSTTHGPAMGLQLCQVLLARAAARSAAAVGPCSAGEDALGLPGGLGGVLEVLLAFITLGNRQLQGNLDALAHQLQVVEAAAEQKEQHSQEDCGGVAAGAAQAATAATSCTSSVTGHGGTGTRSSSDADHTSSRKRRQRGAGKPGWSWFKGKYLPAVLARLSQGAAAGTLAIALMSGSNHPLWRAARLGPLMYLLRTGL